jgi:hypothetical protein
MKLCEGMLGKVEIQSQCQKNGRYSAFLYTPLDR